MNETNILGASQVEERGYDAIVSGMEVYSLCTVENIKEKVTDLNTSIAQLKEQERCLMKQELTSNHELEKLEEQLKNTLEEADLLTKRVHSMKLEELKLKDESEVAERRKQPNPKDIQILDKHKKKLKHYKNLIGLKWDYTAPEDHSVGYVFNTTTNAVKPFTFDNMYSAENIWALVKATAKPDWDKIQ